MASSEQKVVDFWKDCNEYMKKINPHEVDYIVKHWQSNLAVRFDDVSEEATSIHCLLKMVYSLFHYVATTGLNIKPIWKLIHKANMTKFSDGGYMREDGKWCKPPNFVPPDDEIREEIKKQREKSLIFGVCYNNNNNNNNNNNTNTNDNNNDKEYVDFWQDCTEFAHLYAKKTGKIFGGKMDMKFIKKMINDELEEFREAKDEAEQVDAILDIVYYIFDHLVKTGLNIKPIWEIIHDHQMKVCADFNVAFGDENNLILLQKIQKEIEIQKEN